jgi:flavin-dependent dehydrogenase
VLLIGDAAGWVSPMTGGGIRLAFKYGRRAASLVADHLLNGGAAPETALAREVPRLRAKRVLRNALDLAPPNFLIDTALATAPMRRIAERLYFHRRNDAGIDREAYLRWMEQDGYPKAVASRGDAR